MCFSASASFTAAGLLSVIGITAVSRSTKAKRAIAAIPLLFGLQQFSEGLVWLYADTEIARYAGTVFLLFAYLLWPMWIPYAIRVYAQATDNKMHAAICSVCLGFGLAAALGLAWYWTAYGIIVQTGQLHIIYHAANNVQPIVTIILAMLYFIATLIPQITARSVIIQVMGWITTLACAISWWAYQTAFASVWCFFAAIISACVLWFVCQPITTTV